MNTKETYWQNDRYEHDLKDMEGQFFNYASRRGHCRSFAMPIKFCVKKICLNLLYGA